VLTLNAIPLDGATDELAAAGAEVPAGAVDCVEDGAEAIDPVELGADEPPLALGIVPAATIKPPCKLDPPLELLTFPAADIYAARVFPLLGALTAPAMPPGQWVGVLQ